MEIIMGIGSILLIIVLFAFLIWVFKAIKDCDKMEAQYSEFFTKWQAYLYLTFSVMRIVLPVLFTGGSLAMLFSTPAPTSQDILIVVVAAILGVVLGLVMHLLKKGRDKALINEYGPMAGKELAKGMLRLGFAWASSMAWKMFKTVGIASVSRNVIITSDGRIVPVLRFSETQAIDADGNLYEYQYVQNM